MTTVNVTIEAPTVSVNSLIRKSGPDTTGQAQGTTGIRVDNSDNVTSVRSLAFKNSPSALSTPSKRRATAYIS
jgi:hypothetical protein